MAALLEKEEPDEFWSKNKDIFDEVEDDNEFENEDEEDIEDDDFDAPEDQGPAEVLLPSSLVEPVVCFL